MEQRLQLFLDAAAKLSTAIDPYADAMAALEAAVPMLRNMSTWLPHCATGQTVPRYRGAFIRQVINLADDRESTNPRIKRRAMAAGATAAETSAAITAAAKADVAAHVDDEVSEADLLAALDELAESETFETSLFAVA